MINTRARGLAHLHAGATTLFVGAFFWAYANIIDQIPFVRLSREVNLLPYFLCMVDGMALSAHDLSRFAARFHLLELGDAARLAGRQVALMALLTFSMMFATLDRSISCLFLGSFLVWCWLGLAFLNAWLPGALARLVFRRGHQLPPVFIGRVASLGQLTEWIADKAPLGIHPVGLLSDDAMPGRYFSAAGALAGSDCRPAENFGRADRGPGNFARTAGHRCRSAFDYRNLP